jgi:cobalt/nickel transport system permease protein
MKHSFLDRYSDGNRFLHRLDARTKFIFVFLFIISITLTPPGSWYIFIVYFVIMAGLTLVARLPVAYVFKRSLAVMPFVLMIAIFIPFFKTGEIIGSYNIWLWKINVTYSGIQVLLNILIKAWLSILSLIWLTSTTKLTHLLYALERLHFPHVLIMILSFMYRYIFVIADEIMRMKQARDSRNFGGRKLLQLRTIGNMIGTLFIRSYERSERVYTAMVARGFNGQVYILDHLRFKKADAVFGMSACIILITITIANQLL